jgi:ribosomal peptide maturation radical SAM protein 1
MPDVLLVNPPFGNVITPSIGLGILKARLRELCIPVEVYYANLELCAQLGFDVYHLLVGLDNRVMMLGEAIFAEHVYDDLPDPVPMIYNDEQSIGYFMIDNLSKESFQKIKGVTGAYLDQTANSILSKHPRIVGFSSKFYQNLAALALAKRIKEARPEILTVIGGPNVWLPMGQALSEITPWIDYIFSGEAEEVFPQFCAEFLSGKEMAFPKVIDCGINQNIAPNPSPDYDDYFTQLKPHQEAGRLPGNFPLYLSFETSRGCWWAKKRPCSFCGLNPDLSYRKKSADRALEEIMFLSGKYNVKALFATDNVIPTEYLDELVLELSGRNTGVSLFYEVRPHLTSAQIAKLASGGVYMVQAGIESLVTQVLKKMNKGVSAMQNIFFLRECRSFGIEVFWSFIIGIPSEKKRGYKAFCQIAPLVYHLKPPMIASLFRLNRFSEYFNHYEQYGIRNMRHYPVMESLYPKGADLNALSYFFARDHTTEFIQDKPLLEGFVDVIEAWNKLWVIGGDAKDRPKLELMPLQDGRTVITDTRPCAIAEEFTCDHDALDILEEFSTPKKNDHLTASSRKTFQVLRERKFILEYEGLCLSLVNKHMKR